MPQWFCVAMCEAMAQCAAAAESSPCARPRTQWLPPVPSWSVLPGVPLAGTAVTGATDGMRLIQARIDRLAAIDKAALQAAAVLGQRFDLASLRHVLGQPDYAVDRLADRLLVRPDEDGFLFAHALIRDAVYDGLLRSRRRELHGRAAGWYGGRDAAMRALHLDRADDPAAPRAYLEAAAGLFADYRQDAALRLAERGLEHGVTPGLGWIAGEIAPMAPRDAAGEALPLPQMGWNTLDFPTHGAHPLLERAGASEGVCVPGGSAGMGEEPVSAGGAERTGAEAPGA